MKMIHQRIILLIFVVLCCSGVYAQDIDDFKLRSESAFESVNHILNLSDIHLDYADVKGGSAQAQRLPFRGNVITLDYVELENASDVELQGLFAHELTHIETYSHMHFISLAFYGMHYQFSSTFKREVERETDEKAIAHGFGLELKGFRLYRLQTASEKDKVLLETYYLSSDEISALIT
jgi:hypothetical protein